MDDTADDANFFESGFGKEWENEMLETLDEAEAKYASQSCKESNTEEPRPQQLEALKRFFGHKCFRPMQWKIINSLMNQKRDNCAIMTTGYGKSLCYQFPSVYIGGITLIISPLISLMEDQVLAMKIANIPACLLGTANTNTRETLAEIEDNKYSLVYLTPEFCTGELGSELLRNWYQKLSITLIAIDEAHCVSSWGHDFRFQYRKLGMLREIMPTVPMLAVTATATEKIRKDIISILRLKDPQILMSSLDRPNFYFAVNPRAANVMVDLKKVMVQHQNNWQFSGPTIIYCLTRKKTEEISFILSQVGLKCMAYHAGLSISVRKEVHEKFVKDKIDIVVATIAFGMGIDKPDVRNVIHYGISNSIEGYYQEAGRAGRDGLPAKCVVFYDSTDFNSHKFQMQSLPEGQRKRKEILMETVKEYANTRKCRRRFILNYFEETNSLISERPDCCDNCYRSSTFPDNEIYEGIDDNGKYDFTNDGRMFLKAINVLQGRFGLKTYVDFLRGSKKKQLEKVTQNPLHGVGKDKSVEWWTEIGRLLIKFKYAVSVASSFNSFASLVNITDAGKKFLYDEGQYLKDCPTMVMLTCLKSKTNIWISKSQKTTQTQTESKHVKENQESKTEKEARVELYNMLLKKRLDLASTENCMPYMIASNKALMDMAELKPTTLKEMVDCQFDGFTAAKLAKYGEAFVNMIKETKVETIQQKKTIKEVLTFHPMPGVSSLSTSAIKSYSLLNSGKPVDEIAKIRAFSLSTIITHLCDCMKFGYAVKLSQLAVTKDVALIIIKAARDVVTGLDVLTPIKMVCPDHITYNQLKAVVTYLRVREHLHTLGVAYKEFEESDYFQLYNSNQTIKTETDFKEKYIKVNGNDINVEEKAIKVEEITEDEKLSEFIRGLEECDESDFGDEKCSSQPLRKVKLDPCQDLSNSGEKAKYLQSIADDLSADDESILISDSDDEPSIKRSRSCRDPMLDSPEPCSSYSVLDSPPRQSSSLPKKPQVESGDCYGKVQYNSSDDETVIEIQRNNPPKKTVENLKLPPWLMSKRVA